MFNTSFAPCGIYRCCIQTIPNNFSVRLGPFACMDIINIWVIVVNMNSPVTVEISGLRADQKRHAW